MKNVLNTLRVVEEVAERQPIGVGELSRTLGLPKTTVWRALTTLGEAGWLRQEPDASSRWSLTTRVIAFGRGSAHQTLCSLSLPTMGRLRSETEETILLFVRDGDHVVALEGLDGLRPVRAHANTGTRVPLHAGASGKSILAELPDDEIQAYIAHGLEAVTENTITDAKALRLELDRIRKRGYSTHKGEFLSEVSAVGAAILGPDGHPEGALVITGPAERFSRAKVRELGETVIAAARKISDPTD